MTTLKEIAETMRETLLSETIDKLKHHGKSPADVRWVGAGNGFGKWDDFARIANFEYNSSYGSHEIHEDLVVVGDGWWLERAEYDGSEWWEFKTMPVEPIQARPLEPRDIIDEYQWPRLKHKFDGAAATSSGSQS